MKGLQWHWIALWAVLMVVIAQPLGDFELFGLRYYRFGFVEIGGRVVAVLTLLVGMLRYAGLGWPVAANRFARLLAVVLLMWEVGLNADIAYLSWQAHRLCSAEGGVHIKQTAEVDGFLWMTAGIKNWAADGFSYVEQRRSDYTGKSYFERAQMVDGEPVFTVVEDLWSRYEVGFLHSEAAYQVIRRDLHVHDRDTATNIARYVVFEVRTGWFDSLILRFLPQDSGPAHWTCGDEAPASGGYYSVRYKKRVYAATQFVEMILKPRR